MICFSETYVDLQGTSRGYIAEGKNISFFMAISKYIIGGEIED
jgi:hypothetical protein